MKILLFAITINLFRDRKSNLIMISNAQTKKVYARPTKPIGHLGHRLRPLTCKRPPIVIIYYIILLSHLKKKKIKARFSQRKKAVMT